MRFFSPPTSSWLAVHVTDNKERATLIKRKGMLTTGKIFFFLRDVAPLLHVPNPLSPFFSWTHQWMKFSSWWGGFVKSCSVGMMSWKDSHFLWQSSSLSSSSSFWKTVMTHTPSTLGPLAFFVSYIPASSCADRLSRRCCCCTSL